MVRIQGKEAPGAAGMTIAAYLDAAGYDRKRVAVECSGSIIARSEYDGRIIQDGEIIEIVSFVGGG